MSLDCACASISDNQNQADKDRLPIISKKINYILHARWSKKSHLLGDRCIIMLFNNKK